jgi:hypothetical protein
VVIENAVSSWFDTVWIRKHSPFTSEYSVPPSPLRIYNEATGH